ncbi:cholesterol 24-hydroxylase-like [Synchiropus splendidus]|uniref:cholesterol 24-hydroxylase-like n=1 Tax=Synchiropus splendidus TaxID=270530 RepID=UPI00237DF90C|nr:cholesterol 24-hydroxylase-like [Synchiropus splendidus]
MSLISLILSWIPSVLLLLLCGLFACFLCFYAYIKYLHMKYAHIPGPPIEHFLFGHAFILVRIMNTGFVHDKFLEWSETYGPVYKLHMVHHVMIFTTCPETTKKVLVSSKHYKDKIMYSGLISLFGRRFLGTGLVTEMDHDQWYKQRRSMDPAFNSINLKSFLSPINEYGDRIMSKINEAVENESAANMTDFINTFTLDVLAKVAFDIDSDTMKNKSAFTEAIKQCMSGMIINARDAVFQFKPSNKAYVASVREACHFLRETGRDWIRQRSIAIQNNESVPKDILTRILKSAEQDDKPAIEDEELMVDNFVTFFIAGQETTANQIAFCVRELGRYPEILEKVRKEVDEVLGMKQEINAEDLGRLVYLTQVLKEILRLYPIGPLIPRRVNEDLVINGVKIPGGVNVVFSPYVAGRLPKFFKDPLVFDPDRFHPDAPKPYYCYYPFSLGPRNCIGQYLSQMEAKVMVAKFIQRFDFRLTPGQQFGIVDTGSLRPQNDVTCFVKYRDVKK